MLRHESRALGAVRRNERREQTQRQRVAQREAQREAQKVADASLQYMRCISHSVRCAVARHFVAVAFVLLFSRHEKEMHAAAINLIRGSTYLARLPASLRKDEAQTPANMPAREPCAMSLSNARTSALEIRSHPGIYRKTNHLDLLSSFRVYD